jgi:hypothetical protein
MLSPCLLHAVIYNCLCSLFPAGHGSRAVQGVHCLRLLGSRDRGFESQSGHGCQVFVYVCAFFCVCVQVERPCDELITRPRSPTDCPWSRNWRNSALCSKSGSKLPSVGATRKISSLGMNIQVCVQQSGRSGRLHVSVVRMETVNQKKTPRCFIKSFWSALHPLLCLCDIGTILSYIVCHINSLKV